MLEGGLGRRGRDGPLIAVILVAILLSALVFRAWGAGWGLYDATVSRRPHPDEWVVYWVFHWFGRYGSLSPCPRSGTRCFFDWGALYLYLAYAVHAVLQPFLDLLPRSLIGPDADRQFVQSVVSGRATSILLSVGTVYVTFRLGRAVSHRYVGLVAACFVAVSGLLIQLAHFATPDSTTIFFSTAALWAAVEHLRAPGLARLLPAGILVGLAAGSEYNMVLLVLPLVAAWFLADRRRIDWLACSLLALAGAWVAVNPFAVMQWRAFLDAGIHSLRTRTVDSGLQYGDRWSSYGPTWLYVIRYPLGYGVGFAETACIVAGVGWALLRRSRRDLVLLSWVFPYFVLVTLSPAKFMRYSAPLIPALSVLAAELIVFLLVVPRRRVRLVAAVAAVLALLYTAGYDAAYAQLFAQTDARAEAAGWIAEHAQPGSRIGFQEIPDGLLNLPYFVVRNRYQPCFSQFAVDRLAGPAQYVLVDTYEREAHPEVSSSQVDTFLTALQTTPGYRQDAVIRHVPSIGPFTFPITGSPHDWRYPAHAITIYQHLSTGTSGVNDCFPTLQSALQVLYVPPPA